MKAVLRPLTLFAGMYATSAVCIAVASGSLTTGLTTAVVTSVLKCGVAHIHHRCWHRHEMKSIPVAEPVPPCRCRLAA
jgi:uncharacterized membrane protein